MALLLVVIGIVLLVLGYFWIGLALILVGLVLFFAWSGGYGYGHWNRRGGPPA